MKRLIKTLKWFFITLLLLIVVINFPLISLSNTVSDTDHSNWMSENLSNDDLAINITMLGAHDAFSSEINYFSKVDDYSADDILKGTSGILLKGFILRQSVTQTACPTTLLKSGVRYFDVRLSLTDGEWETKHNYISSDFEDVVRELIIFLEENKGEFLILDFQHIHGIDYTSDEDYQLFYEILDGYGILDYSYTNTNQLLSEITYGDLTSDNTLSRVIIIDKFEKDSKPTFDYQSSIRSTWPNNDDFDETINFLIEEADYISSLVEPVNKFVVMQAVTTMQMSPDRLLHSFKTWSLIGRAKLFNSYLIDNEEFINMLDSMPIVMVDYSNTNYEEFNDEIMEIVIQRAAQ